MVFSSLLFVFFFFAITMAVYCYVGTIELKNRVLLISSLIFYAWGGPKYLILLLLMAFISWFSAIQIENLSDKRFLKRLALILGVGIQLGFIGYFKYTMFILENIQNITGFPEVIPEIVLPIGISFYTFQLISYVVDVYRGDVAAQKKYTLVLLYCSLFHQCIAGPIVRYIDVEREIVHRKPKIPEIGRGINRFTIGLFKKAVLANSCAQIADTLLPEGIMNFNAVPALGLWLGAVMYMLQIYLDFSAYSDMAIGMGLMVGFHYKENFNYPYISDSVTEFWRRWHISLSSFFRDYVYIPLGGNRKGEKRTIINLFVVWALTGLWHGASWNFVFWGLYYFVFLILEKYILKEKIAALPKAAKHAYALVVIYFGWIIFKFTDIKMLGSMLKGMIGLNGNGFINLEVSMIFTNNIFFIIAAVIACTPLLKEGYKWFSRKCKTVFVFKYIRRVIEVAGPVVLLFICTMALVGNSYNPFLYFQF